LLTVQKKTGTTDTCILYEDLNLSFGMFLMWWIQGKIIWLQYDLLALQCWVCICNKWASRPMRHTKCGKYVSTDILYLYTYICGGEVKNLCSKLSAAKLTNLLRLPRILDLYKHFNKQPFQPQVISSIKCKLTCLPCEKYTTAEYETWKRLQMGNIRSHSTDVHLFSYSKIQHINS